MPVCIKSLEPNCAEGSELVVARRQSPRDLTFQTGRSIKLLPAGVAGAARAGPAAVGSLQVAPRGRAAPRAGCWPAGSSRGLRTPHPGVRNRHLGFVAQLPVHELGFGRSHTEVSLPEKWGNLNLSTCHVS